MGADYLENLSLSDEEKAKILHLGVSSGVELLAMMRASPQAFKGFLGDDRFDELSSTLEASLDDRERAILDRPTENFKATGAIIDREPPTIEPPQYDIGERDRLFDQLQQLRSQRDSSPETKQRIAEIEDRLNNLLENA